MTREQAIRQIIKILYEYEDRISDGYGFYAGQFKDATIRSLAEDVYAAATEREVTE